MMRIGITRLLTVTFLLPVVGGCSSAPASQPDSGPAPSSGPIVVDSPAPEQVRTGMEGDREANTVVDGQITVVQSRPGLDTVTAGRFDQGKMWTFEFPPLDYLRDEYRLEPDSAWFRRARLGALRIPNCSASFVSPHGLVMTNHHCAREFVSQVSQEGESLLDDGFYARTLDEERAVEDFEADQLIEIVDITPEVEERTVGLTGPNLVEARSNAVESIVNRMEEERGGEDSGWVVEGISLYNGAKASAYVFRRYTSAKLVMAPELQIGFFGGDPDNFTFPRYNLDFSFFRLYDDDGEPLESENYFPWSEEGVEVGDVIFIIGNPGSTSRLQTVAELEFRRDIGDALVLEFIKRRMEVLSEFIRDEPELAETFDLRNTLFSLENQRKAMEGQLAGMRDPVIMARRGASQTALMEELEKDSVLIDEFGDIFEEMREIQRAKRELATGYGSFLALTVADFASATLHRALIAFQVLNGQRAGAPPAQLSELMDELRAVPDKPAALEEALIRARIDEFIANYGEDSWVQDILEGRSPEGAATAIRSASVLSDSAAAVQAIERGALRPDDPGIEFVLSYLPAFGEFQTGFAARSASEGDIARRIGQARFAVYGTSEPPDATFSLRLADGVVQGYAYNGTQAPAYTTFYGLYDRHYSFLAQYGADGGDSPWALPDRWREPPTDFDLSTPVNFVSTADIIGGNSGSPVVNEFLQVVGVVFDGNIESLPGDYIYLPELNRSVTVDSRGILEALDKIYEMDRIVEELTSGALVGASTGEGAGGG